MVAIPAVPYTTEHFCSGWLAYNSAYSFRCFSTEPSHPYMITTALVAYMSLMLILSSLGGGCEIKFIVIVLLVAMSLRFQFVFDLLYIWYYHVSYFNIIPIQSQKKEAAWSQYVAYIAIPCLVMLMPIHGLQYKGIYPWSLQPLQYLQVGLGTSCFTWIGQFCLLVVSLRGCMACVYCHNSAICKVIGRSTSNIIRLRSKLRLLVVSR